jgi:hypothetical protein
MIDLNALHKSMTRLVRHEIFGTEDHGGGPEGNKCDGWD